VEGGDRLFEKYGAVTVFLARFIFGMRVLASLLAGALRMPWRKFAVYNFLGATVWVSAICGAGYLFGGHRNQLVHVLKRFDLAVAVVVAAGALWWWRRWRKSAG
jgi:membrane-associated protein